MRRARGISRKLRSAVAQDGLSELTRLWALRLLVPAGAYLGLIGSHGFSNDAIARRIGLGRWTENEGEPSDTVPESDEPNCYSAAQALTALKKLHRQAEAGKKEVRFPVPLAENLSRLAGLVGMTSVDQQVLAFAVTIHSEPILDEIADWLGPLTSAKTCSVLAKVIDLPEADIRAWKNRYRKHFFPFPSSTKYQTPDRNVGTANLRSLS